MAIVNKQSFSQAQKKRGPLVRVEIGPGRFVKMHHEDAIAGGHIKSKPPAENKMRLPAEDKAARKQGSRGAGEQGSELGTPGSTIAPPADPNLLGPENAGSSEATSPKTDDFTTIPGVGRATARALQARGIVTFEQLKQAGSLDYVSAAAMHAIEQWRQGG